MRARLLWLILVTAFIGVRAGEINLRIDKKYNGEPLPGKDFVSISLKGNDDERAVRVQIDAPYKGDPAPEGNPGEAFMGLWNYEVMELFFLNERGQYLEVEVGPHKHHLVLLMETSQPGALRHSLPLNLDTTITGDRWTSEFVIPADYFPEQVTKVNIFGINGPLGNKEYWALNPAPGTTETPDVHDVSRFLPIDMTTLSKRHAPNFHSAMWIGAMRGYQVYTIQTPVIPQDVAINELRIEPEAVVLMDFTISGYEKGIDINASISETSPTGMKYIGSYFTFENNLKEKLVVKMGTGSGACSAELQDAQNQVLAAFDCCYFDQKLQKRFRANAFVRADQLPIKPTRFAAKIEYDNSETYHLYNIPIQYSSTTTPPSRSRPIDAEFFLEDKSSYSLTWAEALGLPRENSWGKSDVNCNPARSISTNKEQQVVDSGVPNADIIATNADLPQASLVKRAEPIKATSSKGNVPETSSGLEAEQQSDNHLVSQIETEKVQSVVKDNSPVIQLTETNSPSGEGQERKDIEATVLDADVEVPTEQKQEESSLVDQANADTLISEESFPVPEGLTEVQDTDPNVEGEIVINEANADPTVLDGSQTDNDALVNPSGSEHGLTEEQVTVDLKPGITPNEANVEPTVLDNIQTDNVALVVPSETKPELTKEQMTVDLNAEIAPNEVNVRLDPIVAVQIEEDNKNIETSAAIQELNPDVQNAQADIEEPMAQEEIINEQTANDPMMEVQADIQESLAQEEIINEQTANDPMMEVQADIQEPLAQEEIINEQTANDPMMEVQADIQEPLGQEKIIIEQTANDPMMEVQADIQEPLAQEEIINEQTANEPIVQADQMNIETVKQEQITGDSKIIEDPQITIEEGTSVIDNDQAEDVSLTKEKSDQKEAEVRLDQDVVSQIEDNKASIQIEQDSLKSTIGDTVKQQEEVIPDEATIVEDKPITDTEQIASEISSSLKDDSVVVVEGDQPQAETSNLAIEPNAEDAQVNPIESDKIIDETQVADAVNNEQIIPQVQTEEHESAAPIQVADANAVQVLADQTGIQDDKLVAETPDSNLDNTDVQKVDHNSVDESQPINDVPLSDVTEELMQEQNVASSPDQELVPNEPNVRLDPIVAVQIQEDNKNIDSSAVSQELSQAVEITNGEKPVKEEISHNEPTDQIVGIQEPIEQVQADGPIKIDANADSVLVDDPQETVAAEVDLRNEQQVIQQINKESEARLEPIIDTEIEDRNIAEDSAIQPSQNLETGKLDAIKQEETIVPEKDVVVQDAPQLVEEVVLTNNNQDPPPVEAGEQLMDPSAVVDENQASDVTDNLDASSNSNIVKGSTGQESVALNDDTAIANEADVRIDPVVADKINEEQLMKDNIDASVVEQKQMNDVNVGKIKDEGISLIEKEVENIDSSNAQPIIKGDAQLVQISESNLDSTNEEQQEDVDTLTIDENKVTIEDASSAGEVKQGVQEVMQLESQNSDPNVEGETAINEANVEPIVLEGSKTDIISTPLVVPSEPEQGLPQEQVTADEANIRLDPIVAVQKELDNKNIETSAGTQELIPDAQNVNVQTDIEDPLLEQEIIDEQIMKDPTVEVNPGISEINAETIGQEQTIDGDTQIIEAPELPINEEMPEVRLDPDVAAQVEEDKQQIEDPATVENEQSSLHTASSDDTKLEVISLDQQPIEDVSSNLNVDSINQNLEDPIQQADSVDSNLQQMDETQIANEVPPLSEQDPARPIDLRTEEAFSDVKIEDTVNIANSVHKEGEQDIETIPEANSKIVETMQESDPIEELALSQVEAVQITNELPDTMTDAISHPVVTNEQEMPSQTSEVLANSNAEEAHNIQVADAEIVQDVQIAEEPSILKADPNGQEVTQAERSNAELDPSTQEVSLGEHSDANVDPEIGDITNDELASVNLLPSEEIVSQDESVIKVMPSIQEVGQEEQADITQLDQSMQITQGVLNNAEPDHIVMQEHEPSNLELDTNFQDVALVQQEEQLPNEQDPQIFIRLEPQLSAIVPDEVVNGEPFNQEQMPEIIRIDDAQILSVGMNSKPELPSIRIKDFDEVVIDADFEPSPPEKLRIEPLDLALEKNIGIQEANENQFLEPSLVMDGIVDEPAPVQEDLSLQPEQIVIIENSDNPQVLEQEGIKTGINEQQVDSSNPIQSEPQQNIVIQAPINGELKEITINLEREVQPQTDNQETIIIQQDPVQAEPVEMQDNIEGQQLEQIQPLIIEEGQNFDISEQSVFDPSLQEQEEQDIPEVITIVKPPVNTAINPKRIAQGDGPFTKPLISLLAQAKETLRRRRVSSRKSTSRGFNTRVVPSLQDLLGPSKGIRPRPHRRIIQAPPSLNLHNGPSFNLFEGNGDFVPPHPICNRPGLVPDELRCQVFYECVLENNRWQMYSWRCKRGHRFDPIAVACVKGFCGM